MQRNDACAKLCAIALQKRYRSEFALGCVECTNENVGAASDNPDRW